MEKMVVSIVVPFYKTPREQLLNCVNSILNQTYRNLELIVVDDGSGPEYSDLLHEVELMSNKIKMIRRDNNRGLSAARNTGVDYCNGDYVIFVDSDDMLHYDAIRRMVEVQSVTDAEIIIGGLRIIRSYSVEMQKNEDIDYQVVDIDECFIHMLTNSG